MTVRFSAIVGIVIVAAVITAVGGWWWLQRDRREIRPTDQAQVSLGEAVYRERCANCHGADLEGQPNWRIRMPNGRLPAPPHDGSGHTWHHPDEVLFDITKQGLRPFAPPGYQSDMPAFEGVLRDEEIRAVIAYIMSRWPEEILRRQQRIDRQAAQ